MKLCIVGAERSGTSAVAMLLSKASGWSLLDDPPETWYAYRLIATANHGLGFKLWVSMHRHKIVKVPGFATVLPYLRSRMLLPFNTLYCVRDPRDVIASVEERLAKGGYTGTFSDILWLSKWLPPNTQIGTPAEALAWRWRVYLERALAYQDTGLAIHFMKYEDFCQDKLPALRSCAERLNIPFDAPRIEHDLDKQHRKFWGGDIVGPARWKSNLSASTAAAIVEICGPLMERFGYETQSLGQTAVESPVTDRSP